MVKIHTRVKRKYRLTSSKGHSNFFGGNSIRIRPKTFKTEDAANSWAKKNEISKYEVVPAKETKFKVVEIGTN